MLDENNLNDAYASHDETAKVGDRLYSVSFSEKKDAYCLDVGEVVDVKKDFTPKGRFRSYLITVRGVNYHYVSKLGASHTEEVYMSIERLFFTDPVAAVCDAIKNALHVGLGTSSLAPEDRLLRAIYGESIDCKMSGEITAVELPHTIMRLISLNNLINEAIGIRNATLEGDSRFGEFISKNGNSNSDVEHSSAGNKSGDSSCDVKRDDETKINIEMSDADFSKKFENVGFRGEHRSIVMNDDAPVCAIGCLYDNLSNRVKNALHHHEITTVKDFTMLNSSQILNWRNVGKKSYDEISRAVIWLIQFRKVLGK